MGVIAIFTLIPPLTFLMSYSLLTPGHIPHTPTTPSDTHHYLTYFLTVPHTPSAPPSFPSSSCSYRLLIPHSLIPPFPPFFFSSTSFPYSPHGFLQSSPNSSLIQITQALSNPPCHPTFLTYFSLISLIFFLLMLFVLPPIASYSHHSDPFISLLPFPLSSLSPPSCILPAFLTPLPSSFSLFPSRHPLL